MDFSGERFVPDKGLDAEIEIEHLQRYRAVLPLVRGKVVLDAASGSGYGTKLMADVAKFVCGIEISGEAIHHSRANFARANLRYLQGAINALPFPDNTFDVVVSFETIEHVSELTQRGFLAEVRRVLSEDGVFIISTPDRRVYSELAAYHNEFHVKEFYRAEFFDFLSSSFSFVQLYDQFCALGYFLTNHQSGRLEVSNGGGGRNLGKYVVAVCGATPGAVMPLVDDVVIDGEGRHQKKVDRVVELQGEIVEKNHCITTLEEWQEGCRKTIEAQRQLILQKDQAILAKDEELCTVKERLAASERDLDKKRHIEQDFVQLQQHLGHIQQTKAWKIVQSLYRLKDKLSPSR